MLTPCSHRLLSVFVVVVAGGAVGVACEGNGEDASGECPENPEYMCSEPYPCEMAPDECGGVKEITDAGCLRPLCDSDDDCASGEVCHTTCDVLGPDCAPVTVACTDDDPVAPGECVCTISSGPSVRYCLPEDLVPD